MERVITLATGINNIICYNTLIIDIDKKIIIDKLCELNN